MRRLWNASNKESIARAMEEHRLAEQAAEKRKKAAINQIRFMATIVKENHAHAHQRTRRGTQEHLGDYGSDSDEDETDEDDYVMDWRTGTKVLTPEAKARNAKGKASLVKGAKKVSQANKVLGAMGAGARVADDKKKGKMKTQAQKEAEEAEREAEEAGDPLTRQSASF